ncbi:MAG: hypothetical protein ACOX27_10170 [Caldicoprobacterales bacterium]
MSARERRLERQRFRDEKLKAEEETGKAIRVVLRAKEKETEPVQPCEYQG